MQMTRKLPIKLLLLCLLLVAVAPAASGSRKKKARPAMEMPRLRLVMEKDVTCTRVLRSGRAVSLLDTISITFIGDVMQHGKQLQSALIGGADPNLPESYDYSHAFRHIEKTLSRADIAVANMEFPTGIPPYSGYPIFSAPESIAWEARKCGIDLFLLANNHILDKGKRGFLSTLKTYDDMRIRYAGAYRDSLQQRQENPAFFNIKGIRVAILNFTYGTNGFSIPHPCVVNLMDSVRVKEDIAKARKMGADIIICTPHWGEEYQLRPSVHQKRWARILLREGVKVIVGSHPHVPQSAEISPEHILFYSLGNYISNQTTPDYTQLELMVTINIQKNNHTGETTLLKPEYEFLWCFKKDEFAPCYTVVPVKELLGREELVRDKYQYRRMVVTWEKFTGQGLIKETF